MNKAYIIIHIYIYIYILTTIIIIIIIIIIITITQILRSAPEVRAGPRGGQRGSATLRVRSRNII